MAIWQSLRSRDPRKKVRSLEAWIVTIARNKCADYWRTAEKAPVPFPDEVLLPLVDDINVMDDVREALLHAVREAISNLPPIYQEVIELHFFEGWPVRKIAEERQLKLGTVLSRIHEGKKRLRRHFAQGLER